MSLDAGTIRGGIDWDISSYTRGMLQAETLAKIFPEVVTSFLADPLLGLVDIAKEAFEGVAHAMDFGIDAAKEYGNALKEIAMSEAEAGEAAKTLGLSVEAYTGLSGAAKLAGADAMALGEGLKFLVRNIADAATTNVDLRREFNQLGISVTDASGHLRSTEDVLYDMADAMQNLPDAQLRMKYAMDFMGKGAEGMIPLLAGGSARIRELIQEIQRFGGITSTVSAEAGDKYRHLTFDWDEMWLAIKSRATDPSIELIAKNFDKIQGAMFGLSDAAASGINAAFGFIESHHVEIEKAFAAIGDAGKAALHFLASEEPAATAALGRIWDEGKKWKDYIVAEWPEISSECKEIFKTMQTGAISAGDTILNLADDWVRLRIAMEAYTHSVGDMQVKASNDFANQFQKETGHPYSAAMPFVGLAGSDIKGMNLAFGISDLIAPLARTAPVDHGGSAPATQPTYNVNTTVQVDPSKIATEILRQMTPSMKKAIADVHAKSASAGRLAVQRKGL